MPPIGSSSNSRKRWMVMMILLFVLNLLAVSAKYGRLLGWLYIGDGDVSINERMIEQGYAWAYDGGTKNKDFNELREIRKAHGTMVVEWDE